jgi:uncharacterized protein YkwD
VADCEKTARLSGEKTMYRVLSIAVIAATLGACSLNAPSVPTGFSQASETRSLPDTSKKKAQSLALGGEPSAARQPDRAPPGSYERPDKGSLSDRDYTGTSLNAEMARDLINQYRVDNGLKPLVINAKLTEAAKDHCRDLAKWDRISHYGSDGSNPWDRVKRTGYKARIAAENVGTGQINFDEVLKGWKDSPGHNKNLLLSDGKEMGLALVQDPKTEFRSFWTLVIGSSM